MGGRCNDGKTRSRDNFYGFKESNETIKYIPCLPNHCCLNDGECVFYDTCAVLRRDSLWNMSERIPRRLFSCAKCVKSSTCINKWPFWLLFSVLSVVTTLLITCLEPCISVIQNCFQKFLKSVKACRTTEVEEDENEEKSNNASIHLKDKTLNETWIEKSTEVSQACQQNSKEKLKKLSVKGKLISFM